MKILFGILLLGCLLTGVLGAATSSYVTYNVTQIQVDASTGYIINNLVQTPDRVYPGDQVVMKMSFYTTKTDATGVIATMGTPFLAASSTFAFNSLKANDPQPLILTFTIPANQQAGTYPVYIYASDSNSAQKQVALIELTVNEPTSTGILVAKAVPEGVVNTGNSSVIDVDVTNTGNLDATDVIISLSNSSSVFTPLGTDRQYALKIAAGTTVKIPFTLGVAASTAPGYYPLTVDFSYSIDNVRQPIFEQHLGVYVEANTDLLISTDQQTNTDGTVTLSVDVANIGDTAVRSVYMHASSDTMRITGASDKFVGTLNLDDSSTLALTLSPSLGQQNNTRGSPTITVSVSYKDPVNQEHIITKEFSVTSSGPSGSAATGTQRFGRQTNSGVLFGLNILQLIGLVAFIGVVGFYIYRVRKGSQGKK